MAGRCISLKDRSITEIKLADYSNCLVQGVSQWDYHLGLWLPEYLSCGCTAEAPEVTSAERWLRCAASPEPAVGWTVNADTSTITTLTDIGVSEGLNAGGPIPTPTDELPGVYFVVETVAARIKSRTSPVRPRATGSSTDRPGCDPPDIAAGGGGGGAGKLNDLTDVDLSVLVDKQVLQYQALSGLWENAPIASEGALSPVMTSAS